MAREGKTGLVCDLWEAQAIQSLLISLMKRGERGVLVVNTWHWGTSARFITTSYHKDVAEVPPMAGGCCAFYLAGNDIQTYLTMPAWRLGIVVTEALKD